MSKEAERAALLAETVSRQQVLAELQAVTLVEIALLDPDPRARLEALLAREEATVFGAVGLTDPHDPAVKRLLQRKDAFRDEIFDFARRALEDRMSR